MPEILRRLPLIALVLLPAALPSTLSARSFDEPVDARGFVAELDKLASAVAAADQAQVSELRSRLPDTWVVREGPAVFSVSASWLVRPLEEAARDGRAWPAIRSALLAKLAAVRAEAQGAAGSAAGTAEARVALQVVLARSEFAPHRDSGWLTWARQRVAAWLMKLWERIGGGRVGRRGAAIALAWIAVLAALGVLVSWLVRGLVRATSETRLHLRPSASRRISARAWALRAVSSSDPREAARCAYHAAVRRLEEEGVWRIDDARTPREYLRLLPSSHGRRGIVADITHRFEQIWYGGRDATEDDRRDVVARLKDLGCLPAD